MPPKQMLLLYPPPALPGVTHGHRLQRCFWIESQVGFDPHFASPLVLPGVTHVHRFQRCYFVTIFDICFTSVKNAAKTDATALPTTGVVGGYTCSSPSALFLDGAWYLFFVLSS